jgi:hypothetical protein
MPATWGFTKKEYTRGAETNQRWPGNERTLMIDIAPDQFLDQSYRAGFLCRTGNVVEIRAGA